MDKDSAREETIENISKVMMRAQKDLNTAYSLMHPALLMLQALSPERAGEFARMFRQQCEAAIETLKEFEPQ